MTDVDGASSGWTLWTSEDGGCSLSFPSDYRAVPGSSRGEGGELFLGAKNGRAVLELTRFEILDEFSFDPIDFAIDASVKSKSAQTKDFRILVRRDTASTDAERAVRFSYELTTEGERFYVESLFRARGGRVAHLVLKGLKSDSLQNEPVFERILASFSTPYLAAQDLLAALTPDERAALGNIPPEACDATIARKRGVNTQPKLIVVDPSSGEPRDVAAVLWKLDVPSLERLAESLRCMDRADTIARSKGSVEEAAALYQRVFQIDPHNALAVMSYAVCLGQQGQFTEAVAWCERAAELDPKSERIRKQLENLKSVL